MTTVPELAGLDEEDGDAAARRSGPRAAARRGRPLERRRSRSGAWSRRGRDAGSFVKRGAAIEAVLSLGARRVDGAGADRQGGAGRAARAARRRVSSSGPCFGVATAGAAGHRRRPGPAPRDRAVAAGAPSICSSPLEAEPERPTSCPISSTAATSRCAGRSSAGGFRFGSRHLRAVRGNRRRHHPAPAAAARPSAAPRRRDLARGRRRPPPPPRRDRDRAFDPRRRPRRPGRRRRASPSRAAPTSSTSTSWTGEFVPNLTFGPPVVAALARRTRLPLDVHLMVERIPTGCSTPTSTPESARVAVHWEAAPPSRPAPRRDPRAAARGPEWRSTRRRRSSSLVDVLHACDFVLLMSVNPGFAGQPFLPHVLDKTRRLAALIRERAAAVTIEIDGGVGPGNAGRARARRRHHAGRRLVGLRPAGSRWPRSARCVARRWRLCDEIVSSSAPCSSAPSCRARRRRLPVGDARTTRSSGCRPRSRSPKARACTRSRSTPRAPLLHARLRGRAELGDRTRGAAARRRHLLPRGRRGRT